MAYSIKTNISFGLVYIPVSLFPCVKSNDISFNLIDKKTMSRVKYLKTCVECNGKLVKPENIVKGYEYEKDKYVLLDDKDFKNVQSKKDKSITIEQFVKLSEIDPIYYDKCYYITPNGGDKAFALLLSALEEEKKVGIAKIVLNNKEYLVAIRARNNTLLLNTLYFEEQIQENPSIPIKDVPNKKEMQLAKSIITNMTSKFKISSYQDEYKKRLLDAIEKKIAGKRIEKTKEKAHPKINNLMDALVASVKKNKSKSSRAGA